MARGPGALRDPVAEQSLDLGPANALALAVRVERILSEQIDERFDVAVIEVVGEGRVQILEAAVGGAVRRIAGIPLTERPFILPIVSEL